MLLPRRMVRLRLLRQINPNIRGTFQERILIGNVDAIKDPEAMSHCRTNDYERELDLLQIFEAISVYDPNEIEFKLSECDQRCG
ncbi:hypothetical protein [Bradyrhizobium elkanii]|uniref:hypothetical protein n=1 Tax=Bradyrhizobium elkanii TaxID=29448 RepID=UPI00384A9953